MRQFRNFPIYINYNIFTKQEREAALRDRLKKFRASKEGKDYAAELDDWTKKHGREAFDWKAYTWEDEIITEGTGREKRLDEIRSLKQTKESKAYEDKVWDILEQIVKTEPGKLLIPKMVSTHKVWIVMYEGGGYAAATLPGIIPTDQGGGIRVLFDPDGFNPDMEYYTPSDVLYHELVHAYRLGHGKDNRKPLKEYKTTEEFLAIHTQNVFMDYAGHKKYYYSHSNTRLAEKDEIYNMIKTDAEWTEAFKYFRDNEPMVKEIAKLTKPTFNCWRDLAGI